MAKVKGFGLIPREAREKASLEATKTLNTNIARAATPIDEVPSTGQGSTHAEILNEESKNDPQVDQVERDSSSVNQPADKQPERAEASINANNQASKQPAKTAGRKKKHTDSSSAPLNAARVSSKTHKILNMIGSIEGKTQSEIIDELIILHPLYKKLKDLV